MKDDSSSIPLPLAMGKQWDATLYEKKHSFVWKYGEELIELLAPQPGERVLDLGCGTGQLTQRIAAAGADVVGLDRSPRMIAEAQKNFPHLKFVIADATRFEFARPFDAVFSNATLHWIKPPGLVVSCVAACLRPGGRFVAEFGGKGNIRAILGAIRRALEHAGVAGAAEWNPWYYPSIGEYAGLLEQHGLAVTYAVLFDRLTALEDGENGARNWLRMFAADLLARIPAAQQEAFCRSFEQHLRPALFRDGAWFADYRRIRVVAIRS